MNVELLPITTEPEDAWREALAKRIAQFLAERHARLTKHPDLASLPTAIRILRIVQNALDEQRQAALDGNRNGDRDGCHAARQSAESLTFSPIERGKP